MKKKIIIIIKALLTIGAFFLNLELIYHNQVDGGNIFSIEWVSVSISFLLFVLFYQKTPSSTLTLPKKILSILFTVFCMIGNSYIKLGSWNLLFGNIGMLFLSIMTGIGYYFFFAASLKLLDQWLEKWQPKKIKIPQNKYLKRAIETFEKHPFLVSLIVLLVAWLIYMIAFYPIILSPDPSFQIKQYFNEHTKYIDWVIQRDPSVFMTTHHPVIHTVLLGGCIQLGRFLINDNFGLFLYSFLQCICLASTLAYTIFFAKKHHVSSRTRMILLIVYALVPMFPLYAMSGVKDTFYTIFMILYVLALFDIVSQYKNKKLSWKYALYLLLILLLLAMFRNNGLYVILLSFPFLLFFTKTNRFILTSILILFFGSYQCYNKIIIPSFGISEGSIREILSIPFQQTARYVKYHEKELTMHDKKVIDQVLEYDSLSSRYDPEISDPVKNKYNKNTSSKELKEYFQVWLDGLLHHPDTYLQATLNNVYGYFYPNSSKWYIYHKYDSRITQNNLVDYHYNSLSSIRSALAAYGTSFPYFPVLGIISNIGWNTWLVLLLGAYLLEKKKWSYLIVLCPLLASILVCIASPVNTYFRYTMPYVFVLPALLALFIPLLHEKIKIVNTRRN